MPVRCGFSPAGSAFRLILFRIRSFRQRAPSRTLKKGRLSMNPRQILFSTVAAIGIAALAASVPAPLNAQPKPQSAAATGAVFDRRRRHWRHGARTEGAGSRRLGDRRDNRSAHPLHQERRYRRSGPLRHPRPADRKLSGLGCAAMALSTRRRRCAKPGQKLDLTAVAAPSPAAAAHYYRRSTGTR